MKKLKQFLSKGLRYAHVAFILAFKPSGKFRFENLLHPIYLRRNTSDMPTFHQIFTFKDYDFNPGYKPKNIIDAGGNVGYAAVFFANKYPDAKIISIEPELSNFEMMQKNTALYPNITAIKRAVSNESGTTFNVIDNGGGNWMFSTLSDAESEGRKIVDSVQTISIGDIMKEHGLTHIDLLKIDIEGAEKEVFSGNYESWLPNTKCLIIELHDGMKLGCSKNFFSAISKYDFYYRQRGENLVFVNNNKAVMSL